MGTSVNRGQAMTTRHHRFWLVVALGALAASLALNWHARDSRRRAAADLVQHLLPKDLGVERLPGSASIAECRGLQAACGSAPYEVVCSIALEPSQFNDLFDPSRFVAASASGSVHSIVGAEIGPAFEAAAKYERYLGTEPTSTVEIFVDASGQQVVIRERGVMNLDCF